MSLGIFVTSWCVLWQPPNKRRNGIMYRVKQSLHQSTVILLPFEVNILMSLHFLPCLNMFMFKRLRKWRKEVKLLTCKKWNCCLLLSLLLYFLSLQCHSLGVADFKARLEQSGLVKGVPTYGKGVFIVFKDPSNTNHDPGKWNSVLDMFWSCDLLTLWLSMRIK